MRCSPLVVLALTCLTPVARADYALPAETARVVIRADSWQLLPGPRLSVEHEGRTWTWDLNTFWLADRISSDSICGGTWEQVTAAWLARLQAARKRVRVCEQRGDQRLMLEKEVPIALRVELVKAEGSDWFVAGLWSGEVGPEDHQRAARFGCLWLRLTPAEVAALGDEAAWRRRLEEVAEEGWRRLAQPEPPVESGDSD